MKSLRRGVATLVWCAWGCTPSTAAYLGISPDRATGSDAISADGLVAAYDMSPLGTPGVLIDASGNGLEGAFQASSPVPGVFGQALDFSDVALRIQLPADELFDLDGPLTIATWVRVDGTGLHQHIVACDDKWALWVTPDDRYRLGDTRGGGWSTAPGTVAPGRWTSVVAVLRGTRGDDLTAASASIYVGGALADADLHMRGAEARERTTWGPGSLYPRDACYIGFESHQGNEVHQTLPFAGAVDELLVFRRALSESEIAAFSTPSDP